MKFPKMRLELIDYLRGLSDFQYQQSCWVQGNCPLGVDHDEFDYAVRFLFDDTSLAENPESLIGQLLMDGGEVELISILCQKIQAIFDLYGSDLSDEQYIHLVEWKEVVASARKAFERLSLLIGG